MARERKLRKTLLHLTLRGLPELELFPTEQARTEALNEIGTEAGNPAQGSYWKAVAIFVFAVVSIVFIGRWVFAKIDWPTWLEDTLRGAAWLLTFVLVLRWLHRGGAQGELREKLLKNGVPVCLGCGYLLRGLASTTPRCPECGMEIDTRVRELLSAMDQPSREATAFPATQPLDQAH